MCSFEQYCDGIFNKCVLCPWGTGNSYVIPIEHNN